nr:ATP-binding protein [Candidatus Cloacimonadota bacterium]
MYIKRELEKTITKYLHTPEIIAVLGTRQVGKTTLLKNLFENKPDCKFITFEDREILAMFQEDLDSFKKFYLSQNKFLVIDEFQYAKEGGQKLKFLFDTVPNKKIIISGSSSFDLTKQAIKYLVGRIFQFQLHPFSFYEFLSFKDSEGLDLILSPIVQKIRENIFRKKEKLPEFSASMKNRFSKYINEFVIFGGFPRVALAEDFEEKQTILNNIFSTYLLKEVREILNLSDDFKIEKLAKYLALNISGLLQIEDISNFVGTNHKKTIQLMNILEKTFIVEFLNPFYTNKLLEIIKSKKVFVSDTGFRNSIIHNF